MYSGSENDQQPSSSTGNDSPGSSIEEPCSSRSWTYDKTQSSYQEQSRSHDRSGYDRQRYETSLDMPSTSREPRVMRRVDWDTLERNWSGHSSSGSSWRAPNRPPPLPPRSQYYSKKGKGIGKGRRYYERPSTSAGGMSSSNSGSSSLAGESHQVMSPNSTLSSAVFEEDYVSEFSNMTPQIEPMDLSINEASDVDCGDDLEIDEPFDDTVVVAGEPISLINTVNGNVEKFKWFRNGQEIVFNARVQALVDRETNTYTLKIRKTTRHDHGIYKFEVSNNKTFRLCRGKLFVGDDIGIWTIICIGYTQRHFLDVTKPLKPVTVFIGDSFELSATFFSQHTTDHKWFKNDQIILFDHHCVITSTNSKATLKVTEAKMSDTGIYTVVVKTCFGITSSWTDVHVFNNVNLNELIKHEPTPSIEEAPVDTVVHEGNDVRLSCKVRSNSRSDIKWSVLGTKSLTVESEQVTDYGDNYLTFMIKNVKFSDAGTYGIQLEDRLTGTQKMEHCTISVFHDHSNIKLKILKHLVSYITICGAAVTLDCRFDVRRCTEYFVTWRIGHYTVTFSDSRFHMECYNGICLLEILQMEPGMTGEVVCEISTPVLNGKLVARSKTTCNLAIVPVSVIMDEYLTRFRPTPCLLMRVKYSVWSDDGLFSIGNCFFRYAFHLNQPPLPVNYTLFYIDYTRLENTDYYYLKVKKIMRDGRKVVLSVSEIETVDRADNGLFLKRNVGIEWEYQGSRNVTHNTIWYRVDIQMPGGVYLPTIMTSRPQLLLNCPGVNEPVSFRISTFIPKHKKKNADVSMTHRPNNPVGLPLNFLPCPLYEYPRRYKNKPGFIGAGSYGSICIATQYRTKVDYAVKTIIFKSFEHRVMCYKECHLLKTLKHDNIVVMVDAYHDDRQLKLVMECLWGGDLFERIASSSYLVESDVIVYVRQICDALIYLHDRYIAHLDLKPENIMCVHPNSRKIKVDRDNCKKPEAGPISKDQYFGGFN